MSKFDKVELEYDATVESLHESHDYQRLEKQCKLLENSCSTLQEEVSRKSEENRDLVRELREKEAALQLSTATVDRLNEEMYLLGEKRKEISQYNTLKEKADRNQKRIEILEVENVELREKLEI
jgi:hypothetical protein